jgi:outer membrane receptor protein involved in Fe transport
MTSEKIEVTGSKTLAEALQYAPGIVVTHGAKNEPRISVHGFQSEKSLILIDGIPYYETYYGKLNLDQIPTAIISKIEITKNAPSVLYGANAQIAVINVVTKKGTPEPTWSLTSEVGANNTSRIAVNHGNQIGKFNYWLSYSRKQTDGWRLSDDFDPELAQPQRRFMGDPAIAEDGRYRENSDLSQDAFWGRVGFTPNQDSEYFLSVHVVESERGIPFDTSQYRVFDTRGDDAGFSNIARFKNYDDWGIDLSGKQKISPWINLRGKVFYHEHSDDYVSYADFDLNEEIAVSTYEDSYVGASLIADMDPVPWHKGHISLHYKKDKHDDRAGANLPFARFSSYTGSVGTEHSFFTQWGLTAVIGASYDWFEVSSAEENVFDEDDLFAGQEELNESDPDAELNPMAGLIWDISDKTRIYGSVAKKTQFPRLQQLYSGSSGNPDLDSEKTINYTAGVQHFLGQLIHVRADCFYHDISDWISRDYYAEDFLGDTVYVNVEDVEMKGFELGLKWTPIQSLGMSVEYTYNDAENKSSGAVTRKVSGVAENQFVAAINAVVPVIDVRMDIHGIYVDKIYEELPTTDRPDAEITSTSDYFFVNLRLAKDLLKNIEAYAQCQNLFDKDYESEIGYPGRGRNIFFGIKATY